MQAPTDLTIAQPPRLEIDMFIELMGGRNRPVMRKILEDHRPLLQTAAGSRSSHHSWPGGYWDHVTECLNLAVAHYALWSALRPLPYDIWEAYEVLFVHDLEKPWKYVPDMPCPIPVPDLSAKPERAAFRLDLLGHYGVRFTAQQRNAMKYCEGEGNDHHPERRVMEPLAHLCHTCDETSARQFPDSPRPDEDPWVGARRISSPS
jgi:hypothetical protein